MKPFLLAAATVAAAFSAVEPATPSGAFVVRTVTMDGVKGPAYYSVTAKRFRFVTPMAGHEVATASTQASG